MINDDIMEVMNMVAMPDEVIKMFENPDCDKQKVLTWISTVTEKENHIWHRFVLLSQ